MDEYVSRSGEGEGKARHTQERCETGKLDLCDMQTNLLLAWLEKGATRKYFYQDIKASRSG